MRHKIPIKIVELENGNYHLVVDSTFSDGRNGKWVIDTGASKSIFDEKLEAHIERIDGRSEDLHSAGIGAEPMISRLASLKPLQFGSLKEEEMQVALIDLSHINELYTHAADLQICGLLGGDFLMRHHAIIDYKRKRLVLRS